MVLTCNSCGASYLHRQSLSRHIRALHPKVKKMNSPPPPVSTLICGVCLESEIFPTKRDFIGHISSAHDTLVSSGTVQFDSMEGFREWKNDVEHKTCSFYKKVRGTYFNKDSQKMKFVCNRSGHYSPSGKGIRLLKTQGSRKMGSYCPSEMKLKIDKNGKCIVHFVETHWGHGQELAHISLTTDEREAIASKIATNVPLSDILYEVRQNTSKFDERMELLTKKDLRNIIRSFNGGCAYKKHDCDARSVDAWVREIMTQPDECLLFYKSQGSRCIEFPSLTDDNFLLAFMNNAQASMLAEYGDAIICMDGNHSVDASHYGLVTLMVVDDLREGFPCAFLFTNRTDKETLGIFFTKIKARLQSRMPVPKVFMTDTAESFYTGWIEAMEIPPKNWLYCTWHVDRDWQKNLATVTSTEKKSSVYKMIRSLLEEADENEFAQNLSVAVERMLDDPETVEFGEYFRDHFAQNPHLWARCYRQLCGVNTNIYIESMHKCLKYIEFEMRKVNRLDVGVIAVLKYLFNKTFERINLLRHGELSVKLKDIKSQHIISTHMNRDVVIQNGKEWSVASLDTKEIYTVSKFKDTCLCTLYCAECSACIHRYVCTCLDSLISCNMCRHIHLVLMKIREMNIPYGEYQGAPSSLEMAQVTPGEANDRETTNISLPQVSNDQTRRSDNAMLRVQQETLDILMKAMTQIKNSMSFDEIVAAKALAVSILPAMAEVRERSAQM